MLLRARAPAKVNLTLHVLGRRLDGFHELDSLVAFAGCAADALTLEPDGPLSLAVEGPFSDAAGPTDDNLVLKAAREAAARIEGLRLGRFTLVKRVPVAAGIGGGSADAGAALRLLCEANGLPHDDARIVAAAAATGSDVPACLESRAAMMRGRGEGLAPVDLPPLCAVLANPLKPLSTVAVYHGLGLAAGERLGGPSPEPGATFEAAVAAIAAGRNDLEPPARALEPAVVRGVAALSAVDDCLLARMSGSGATVFGLFDDVRAARRAARTLRGALPGWWIRPTLLQ
ncbi:4-(cytidine 5'-diphospho)-2-C-methyl-D-erythritol kinase [Hansschlegelia beijingensis]|uniref:4-diphosphocytidyl-2-C-methyl-D-erythritol kinase n=1 Tax=Hansschlegelia beijingensis TaxID=1133344 RepID=A0A7W6GH83_9HYPH|nr:4-(cytidine 5'-diphospho)-2-C-methyl-D-erythritol kinase [Hansschlegelia beijingensis]MBB3973504.1 4-diphosphocytidyl-2-C-methyl-D-erythritol kinase [Hansschlegelia beijingensis]